MSDQKFATIAVNQTYPFALPPGEGAVSDFLRPSSNRLLIVMPDISNAEAKAFRKGEMRGGLLAKNGALLFIWQFLVKGKPVISLDSPFDARLIPDVQLYNVDSKETRLAIDVHIVDSASKIIKGLRAISMPPGFSIEFLSAVQDQISSQNNGEQQLQQWMTYQPHELSKQTHMWLLGK